MGVAVSDLSACMANVLPTNYYLYGYNKLIPEEFCSGPINAYSTSMSYSSMQFMQVGKMSSMFLQWKRLNMSVFVWLCLWNKAMCFSLLAWYAISCKTGLSIRNSSLKILSWFSELSDTLNISYIYIKLTTVQWQIYVSFKCP